MTDEQLKYRFFCLYLGYKIRHGDNEGLLDGLVYSREQDQRFAVIHYSEIDVSGAEKVDECQLVLRPLSEISDEDLESVLSKSGNADNEFKIKRTEGGISIYAGNHSGIFRIWINHSSIFSYSDMDGGTALEVIDFLRSKGYSLPFQGIDPIQAGWAVLEGKK